VELRPATFDDLPAIQAIDAELGIEPRVEWLRRRIDRSECRVAQIDGELAGFIVDDDAFFDRTFIRLVVTARKFRRRGVADALIADAERRARTPTVFSSSNRSNTALRALLLKRGWVESGIIEGLDELDPETVFRKRVREPDAPPGTA
jgi:GNAT superfamily N-acetyltransferase